jgi:hypothetical protein
LISTGANPGEYRDQAGARIVVTGVRQQLGGRDSSCRSRAWE